MATREAPERKTHSDPQPGEHLGGKSNALLAKCQEATAPTTGGRPRSETGGQKFTFLSKSSSRSSPSGEANSGREASSRGVVSGPGPLLRARSLRFGARQRCSTQGSLLPVEGRERSREQSPPETWAATPGAKPWKWLLKGLGLHTLHPAPFSKRILHLLPSGLQLTRRP